MGRRGMSADDKRATVLRLFHEAKRPFTLKDVERLASKAGVVQNTVKDVLKDLTDDNLVDMDKIGATNWFWSFPSKEANAVRSKLKTLVDRRTAVDTEITNLREREEELLKERPETEARKAKLAQLETLKRRKVELEEQLNAAKASDPAVIRKLQASCAEAKANAERWTDNTWAAVDWLKKKYGMSSKDAMKQLGITDEFDYPAYTPKVSKAVTA